MGAIILTLAESSDLFEEFGGNEQAAGFMLGFTVGLVMMSTVLSTISSAVNTVIVLLAEAPIEFRDNYAKQSDVLVEAWKQAGLQVFEELGS